VDPEELTKPRSLVLDIATVVRSEEVDEMIAKGVLQPKEKKGGRRH
jgi:hypothetical protein